MVGKIVRQCLVIYFRLNRASFQKGFDLGREIEGAVVSLRIVKRLHTQAIARDEELAFRVVPNRKSEHAAEMIETVFAVFLIKMKNRLGVAMSIVLMTMRFQ